MKNNFGTNISWTLFGESHGPAIGITLDGLPAGFQVDMEQIKADMDKRKATGKISTQRHEADEVHVISGMYNGYTTGTALTIIIENQNTKSKDYSAFHGRLRPGHADFTAFEKYNGYQDYRGGGHFSGRLTACIVAAGSICRQILKSQGIVIGSHIESLYTLSDIPFSQDYDLLEKQIQEANEKIFAVIDDQIKDQMIQEIEKAAAEGDSLGGILETAVIGLPANLFFGTGIPVCVLVLKRERNGNSDNILFIDASNDFEAGKNQNILRECDIDKIVETYEHRVDVDKYAHVATMQEIEENGFNLNIPRYVDTFEPEEEIDLNAVAAEIRNIQAEIKGIDAQLKPFFDELGLDFPFDVEGK